MKRLVPILLLIVAVAATDIQTVNSAWEIPSGEMLSVEVFADSSADEGDICSFAVYRGYPRLGSLVYNRYTSSNNTITLNSSSTIYGRDISPVVVNGTTPVGYVACVDVEVLIGDPKLQFFYGDRSGSITYIRQIVPDPSETGLQCTMIPHIVSDDLHTSIVGYANPIVGVKCYNCEAGVNEVALGTTDVGSSSSYTSVTEGASWVNDATSEYSISFEVYYNPDGTNRLVEFQRDLPVVSGFSGTILRDIPIISDLNRLQERLVLDQLAYTVGQVKIDDRFLIGQTSYYKITCGDDLAYGVFKAIPSIEWADLGYNTLLNVYANMGILFASIFVGVVFASIGTLLLLISLSPIRDVIDFLGL